MTLSDPRLAGEWERCWPMLAPAVALAGGTINKALLEADIDSKDAQFWPAKSAALITGIHTHRTGLRDCTAFYGGGDLGDLLALQAHVERFAKENRCDRMVCYGRRGWGRALAGFTETASIFVKDLR